MLFNLNPKCCGKAMEKKGSYLDERKQKSMFSGKEIIKKVCIETFYCNKCNNVKNIEK